MYTNNHRSIRRKPVPTTRASSSDLTQADHLPESIPDEPSSTAQPQQATHGVLQRLGNSQIGEGPYEGLDRASNEIRLVRVLSNHAQDRICCYTKSFALDKAPEYLALSYRWGNYDPALTIQLNENIVAVRKNLLRFLSELQPQYRDSYFWIDALCIDQTNQQERTHQVGLMARIYSTATCVLVWLGPSYGDSGLAMRVLARRQSWSPEALDKLWRKPEGSAIRQLCDRAYWTRLWVLQELMLAQKAILLCGKQQVPWEYLERFLNMSINDLRNHRNEHRINSTKTAATAFITGARQSDRKPPLPYQVVAFRHLQCSEPRDRVYALLSIAEQGQDSISPDYTLGIPLLLNRALEQGLSYRPPRSLLEVRQRADVVATSVGFSITKIYALEKWTGCEEWDALQHMTEYPFMHHSTGISLWWCVYYRHAAATKLWLADSAAKSADIDKALVRAAYSGHEAVCRLITRVGAANCLWRDEQGNSALYYAATKGHIGVVRALLAGDVRHIHWNDAIEGVSKIEIASLVLEAIGTKLSRNTFERYYKERLEDGIRTKDLPLIKTILKLGSLYAPNQDFLSKIDRAVVTDRLEIFYLDEVYEYVSLDHSEAVTRFQRHLRRTISSPWDSLMRELLEKYERQIPDLSLLDEVRLTVADNRYNKPSPASGNSPQMKILLDAVDRMSDLEKISSYYETSIDSFVICTARWVIIEIKDILPKDGTADLFVNL